MASLSSDDAGRPPTLTMNVIGDYSVDGDGKLQLDRRHLGLVALDWDQDSEKEVNYDLNLAQEKVVRSNTRVANTRGLHDVLEWLQTNTAAALTPAPHFVTTGSVLQKVVLASCEGSECLMYATKFKDTIYLQGARAVGDEADQASRDAPGSNARLWSFKFRHYMTQGSDPENGINENESYNCVIKAQLANHSLVYSCEVDGVHASQYEGHRLPRQHELVELKTQQIKTFSNLRLNWSKLRATWAQCAVAGVPRVVVGFRDEGGTVLRLRSFHVKDFPSMANGFFSPDAMMTSLDTFLRWTRAAVAEDNPTAVYEIRVSGSTCSSRRLSPDGAEDVLVLPLRYYQEKMKEKHSISDKV